MVRHHISDDVKELALSMSLQGITDSEICELMGISERSLKRLQSSYRKAGVVSVKPAAPGWPHNLTTMAVQVRQTFLAYIIASHIAVVPLRLRRSPA